MVAAPVVGAVQPCDTCCATWWGLWWCHAHPSRGLQGPDLAACQCVVKTYADQRLVLQGVEGKSDCLSLQPPMLVIAC